VRLSAPGKRIGHKLRTEEAVVVWWELKAPHFEEMAMKLNVKAFALASAVIWGLGLFALTWWMIALDGPSDTPTFIGKLYRGYTITPLGSVIGLAWAFFDALIGCAIFVIGCAIFALLYNFLVGLFTPKVPESGISRMNSGLRPSQTFLTMLS